MNSRLDTETINTLRLYKDKEGKSLLTTLGEIFVNTVPTEVKKLRSYFDNREFSSLENSAHSLKSTVGGLGATVMLEALNNIEDHLSSLEGGAPNESMLAEWMKIAEAELDPVIVELKKLL